MPRVVPIRPVVALARLIAYHGCEEGLRFGPGSHDGVAEGVRDPELAVDAVILEDGEVALEVRAVE